MILPLLSIGCHIPSYWKDPRIHSVGNDSELHAMAAPMATRLIDLVSYQGRSIRNEVHDAFVRDTDKVADFGCGVGISTVVGGVGIDLSTQMLRVATNMYPNGKTFEIGNVEEWGRKNSFDVVTVFFVLHELPQPARLNLLRNALRVSKTRVIVCDISPQKVASPLMLEGEPFLLNYQRNILQDVEDIASEQDYITTPFEIVPSHVLICVIEKL